MAIYVIQAGEGGPVKIGIAADVRKRVAGMQTASSAPLTFLHVFEGGSDEERILHARFASHRIAGEWFAPAPEILAGEFGLRALPLPCSGRKVSPAVENHPLLHILRQARMSQKQLADLLGITKSAVTHWTHGRNPMSADAAAAICAVAGAKPYTLRPDIFGPDDAGAVQHWLSEISKRTGIAQHILRPDLFPSPNESGAGLITGAASVPSVSVAGLSLHTRNIEEPLT